MPTPLPTLASPPPPTAPDIRRPQPRRAEAPGPSFDKELSEKRQVEHDRRAAEAAERPDHEPDAPAVDARDTTGDEAAVPPTDDRAAESIERNHEAQSADPDAQGVPSETTAGDAAATAAAEEILAALSAASDNRSRTVALDSTASRQEPGSSETVSTTPGMPSGEPDGTTQALITSPVRVAETADRPQSARPLPPAPAPAGEPAPTVTTPIDAAGDGSEPQTDGRGADSRDQDQSTLGRHPAMGRAVQVQAAVHLDNLTGQGPVSEMTSTGRAAAVNDTKAQLPMPFAPDSDGNPTTGRVLRGLNAMVNQRGGVMNMRLDPPDLGQLRIQMTIARGVVTARFQATTAEAQALLDRSLSTLRTALESHGLTVERLTVQGPQASGAQGLREHATDEQLDEQRDHTDAGRGRSRGRNDDPTGETPHGFAATFDNEFEMPDAFGAQGAEAA